MAKLLFLFLIGFVVYWLIRGYIRGLPKGGAESQVKGGEDMVRCERCGVHLPRSESILADGKFYCSEEHRRGG